MKYQSTRNSTPYVNSLQAVLRGLAPDGGLYVPADMGEISFDWKCTLQENTFAIATRVLQALLPDFADMPELVRLAYTGKFETEELTPTVEVGEDTLLELFRGPTSAFKDVALSMLPRLLCAAKSQLGHTELTWILTATSGDTGKAALVGFADVPGVKITVFYPQQGVSPVQKAQMVTQTGANVQVCAVEGNFDDAQTGVKKTFAALDEAALAGSHVALSSANSINIGRLAPQLTYYFKAYADMVARGKIRVGDRVDFVVPTGNFGDILAGYLAQKLGLPVGRLVCASNANNVLTEFLQTGRYDRRRPFYKTSSPSMDILISSNLERLLYFVTQGDTQAVAGWMRQLNAEGCYTVPASVLHSIQQVFGAGCCNDAQTAQAIAQIWQRYHYLADPHTAVAWYVAQQYKRQNAGHAPVAILSTASPYKFPAAVLSALGEQVPAEEFDAMEELNRVTGVAIPAGLATLRQRRVLHTDCVASAEITDYVKKSIGL